MEGLLFVILVSGVLLAFLRHWIDSPSTKGRLGERKVHRALIQSLDTSRYTILRDVTLNVSRGTTQIDHIVVSQYGIFVIETKAMSGWIFGSERNPQWTQTFHRKKVSFQNPLLQNHAHVKALQELLGLGPSKFHSMVVFAGDSEFNTAMPANVMPLNSMLSCIRMRTTQILGSEEVQKCIELIESSRMTAGRKTNQAHIAFLRSKHGSPTGVVREAHNFIRQGSQALAMIKLAAGLVVILAFFFIVRHALDGVAQSFAKPTKPVSTISPAQAPKENQQLSSLQILQQEQAARARQKEIDDYLKWQGTLMCGYSEDTMRCACYDPKGGKVSMEFEECKALADKGTGIIRR